MPRSLPAAVTDRVGDEPWEPYPTPGATSVDLRWPGSAWQVGHHQVRRAAPAVIHAAVERHRWLAERRVQPELVVADGEWLVTVGPGHPAHHPERQPVPDEVPALIGEALRLIHDLDVTECPFAAAWDQQVAAIEQAVAAGRVDAAALPSPYDRYDPGRLVTVIHETRPSSEPSDDLVVCHGTPVLPNLFLDSGRFAGWTGLARLGVADRHADLAVAHRSIHALFGPDAVFGFYEGYGAEPDLVALDHYILIDVVLAAVAQPDPDPSEPSPPEATATGPEVEA